MPVILNTKFIYKSSTQLGIKSTAVTSLIGNTAGLTLIGGTATTADLTLQTTSGVGTTNADMHFLVGNNGATEAMTILNSGNVGIGTTGPVSKFDISDNSSAHVPILSIRNISAGGWGPQINMDTYGYSGSPAGMFTVLNVAAAYGGANGGYVSFDVKLQPQSSAIESIRLKGAGDILLAPTTGNVGIGTTNPGEKLEVNGKVHADHFYTGYNWTTKTSGMNMGVDGIAGGIGFYDGITSTSASIFRDTDSKFYVGVRGGQISQGITIDTAGNVGIGTTGPAVKLDVVGAITSSTTITAEQLTSTDDATIADVLCMGASGSIGMIGRGTAIFTGVDAGDLSLRSAGELYLGSNDDVTPDVTISTAGNVGIGVTDPDTMLEVFGATGLKISFDATDNTTLVTDTNGDLTITPSGDEVILADAKNLTVGTSTGTEIGTATGQKLGFWGVTPVVQQVFATGASHTVDELITVLQTLGLVKQS